MEAAFPLIRELDGLFRQDPDIDELGIIFCKPPAQETPAADSADSDDANAGATSSSEPHFILQEHKLGVSVHSVHPLINEARRAFPAAREDYTCARRGELGSDSTDQQGVGCGDAVAGASRLLSVTRALLLVNADHGSAWNARKALVRDGVHESINVRQEIKLLNLIFTKHAKSPNAWAHRRWCWRNEERFRRPQTSPSQPLDIGEELKVCERVADLYPKNYYAWTQRSWVVLRVVGSAIEGGATEDSVGDAEGGASSPGEQAEELLRGEICFLDKWLTSHVSDHSALNHRKNVVSALAAVSSASGRSGLDLVDQERSSNSVLIQDYPGHESLWCYRRFLCQTFLVAAPREALLCTPPTVEHRHQQQRQQQQQQQQQQPDDHRAQDCHDTGLTTAGGGGVTPDEQGMAVSTPAPVPVPVAEGDGALATAAGDRYDWPRWNRAVAEWYETCVRADADEENSVEGEEDSDEGEEDTEESGEEDEHDGTGDLVEGGATDLSGVPGGELPGSIAGGGMLEEFLGREACFALKCATDQGAWQFVQQRRHALAHLAFTSYASARVLGSNRQAAVHQTDRCRREGRDALHSGTAAGNPGREADSVVDNRDNSIRGTSCEVTGAPKLRFPLGLVSDSGAATTPERLADTRPEKNRTSPSVEARHSRDSRRDSSSSSHEETRDCQTLGSAREDVLGALRSLNVFAAGLSEADAAAKRRAGGECCGGTAPYRMQT